MKDGTYYLELDFGSRHLKGGLIRIPPGGTTEAHSHHETEAFLLASDTQVGLRPSTGPALHSAGDVGVVPPFQVHQLHNFGSIDALVYDLYFEEADVYQRAAKEIVHQAQTKERSMVVVDRRREPSFPSEVDFLVKCYEQQGRRIITHSDETVADAPTHGNLVSRDPMAQNVSEPNQVEAGSLSRFCLSRGTRRLLQLTFASPENETLTLHAKHDEIADTTDLAMMVQAASNHAPEHCVVAFDVSQARRLPLVAGYLSQLLPEQDLSSVVLFADLSEESTELAKRLERGFNTLANDVSGKIRTVFRGMIPVPGMWTSDHLSAFDAFETLQLAALGLLDPTRFSSRAILSILDDLLELTQDLWANTPWNLVKEERFESEARTTTALVVSGLYQISVIAAPFAELFSKPPSFEIGTAPRNVQWSDARRLLSGLAPNTTP